MKPSQIGINHQHRASCVPLHKAHRSHGRPVEGPLSQTMGGSPGLPEGGDFQVLRVKLHKQKMLAGIRKYQVEETTWNQTGTYVLILVEGMWTCCPSARWERGITPRKLPSTWAPTYTSVKRNTSFHCGETTEPSTSKSHPSYVLHTEFLLQGQAIRREAMLRITVHKRLLFLPWKHTTQSMQPSRDCF